MICTYSKAKDGARQITEHFKIREFACKDGSDTLLVSDELVELLEKIRAHFGKPITVTSGYRTVSHDIRVGGSGKGYHTKGMAADIVISGVAPAVIALYAQSLLGDKGGVECGCYATGGYVHVDVRPSKWRAVKAYADRTYQTLSGNLFPQIKQGSRKQSVVLLQRLLNEHSFDCGNVDGSCGPRTKEAIKKYQQANGLKVDGICGPLTWNHILGIAR